MRVLLGLLVAAGGCCTVFGQPADAGLTFEVASVRPAAPVTSGTMNVRAEGGPGTGEPEKYTVENLDFAGLVMFAYDIRRDQIVGPDWIRGERYNITARVPAGATRAQFRVMLQNLLAERFALKIHWGSRERPIFQLTAANGGPKLKESKPETPEGEDRPAPRKPARGPEGYPSLPPGDEPMMLTSSVNGGGVAAALRGRRETAAEIAEQLSHQLGRTVTDATGLEGRYDYTLYWIVAPSSRAATAIPPDPNGSAPPAEEASGPTLREAIEQQLGLKLEPARGPEKTLFIDRVESKPAEN